MWKDDCVSSAARTQRSRFCVVASGKNDLVFNVEKVVITWRAGTPGETIQTPQFPRVSFRAMKQRDHPQFIEKIIKTQDRQHIAYINLVDVHTTNTNRLWKIAVSKLFTVFHNSSIVRKLHRVFSVLQFDSRPLLLLVAGEKL